MYVKHFYLANTFLGKAFFGNGLLELPHAIVTSAIELVAQKTVFFNLPTVIEYIIGWNSVFYYWNVTLLHGKNYCFNNFTKATKRTIYVSYVSYPIHGGLKIHDTFLSKTTM